MSEVPKAARAAGEFVALLLAAGERGQIIIEPGEGGGVRRLTIRPVCRCERRSWTGAEIAREVARTRVGS